jgi:hypothetical protein
LTTVNPSLGWRPQRILVRDQQRERRLTQHSIGRAARQQFMQTRMAVAAHPQQVGIELATFFDQRVDNLVLLADGAIFDGVDP